VGVSRRTIARWREWWRSAFAASPFRRMAAAAFMPPVDRACLPATLPGLSRILTLRNSTDPGYR